MARNTLSIKTRVSAASKKVKGMNNSIFQVKAPKTPKMPSVKSANKTRTSTNLGRANRSLGKVAKVSVVGPRSNRSSSIIGMPNYKPSKGSV